MPEVEKCNCPITLKPMAEWVSEEDTEKCRPCLLAPVTQWYRTELTDAKKQDQVKLLDETILKEKAEALQICQVLDRIKDEVEGSLRERLKDFDCAVQTFNPDETI
jgi:hypothetical protein